MINSSVYDYVDALGRAADASWYRNEVIANNIANIDTPNYKRHDVSFEGELKRALGWSQYESMDSKVSGLKKYGNLAKTYVDHANYSYRVDGNNVDIDTENVMLAENQIYYRGVMSSLQEEFANMKAAMAGP